MYASPAHSGASGSNVVLERTIPSQHAKLAEAGILDSLKLPKPVPPLTIPRNSHSFTMQVFWDSDVGKWIEAASYALAHRRDADIEAKIDAIVDDLARAQSPDGYLNCWYIGREPDKRWTNLRDNHELYNAGHLLEGAIAYFRATGRRKMLDIMERYVDHIAAVFGRGPGPEARLSRASGDRARAGQALPPDRRPPAARSRRLFHRRARPSAAALFHRGGAGARRRSGELLGRNL